MFLLVTWVQKKKKKKKNCRIGRDDVFLCGFVGRLGNMYKRHLKLYSDTYQLGEIFDHFIFLIGKLCMQSVGFKNMSMTSSSTQSCGRRKCILSQRYLITIFQNLNCSYFFWWWNILVLLISSWLFHLYGVKHDESLSGDINIIWKLSQVAMTHPMAVTNCNIDMESLISDQNRSIATLAITTLLKTGNESSVDRLMKQITNFMSDIADEFKIVVVEAIRSLCLKFPLKYRSLWVIFHMLYVIDFFWKFRFNLMRLLFRHIVVSSFSSVM